MEEIKVSIIDEKDQGKVIDVLSPKDIYDLAAIVTSQNWSPGEFNEGRRTNGTFKKTSLFALDIDEGCSLAAAKEIFKDYKHVIATSKSHQKSKGGVVADRFRVVLFLDRPINSDGEYKATFALLKKQYPFIDEACKDAARYFYPAPKVVSINSKGDTVPAQEARELPTFERVEAPDGERGELWKSTYKFLAEGAAPGHRHSELVKAAGNMLEQGYTTDEIKTKVDIMAEKTFETDGWGTPYLNQADIKTIERMGSRDLKYSYAPKEQGEQPNYLSAAELVGEAIEYLSDKEGVKGEPTGIDGLDSALGGGFRKGELTVLMAQAKTGKNTLLHYILHSYLKRNIPQGYASRELSPANEVIPNLLSIELGVNAWTAEITEELQNDFQNVVQDWQLYFSPGYGHFPEDEMVKWFKTMKRIGVDFFIADHFHYMLLKEDYEATSKLIKSLKSMTKELDIHIALIVQPRSLRDDERMSLSTLRGGAAIGQALDNLLILERERNAPIPNISKLTLEVARHKLARPGKIYLKYDPETTRMQEVDRTLIQPTAQRQDIPRGVPAGTRASTAFNRPTFTFDEN